MIPGAVSVHGGADQWGVPLHDFSTNANACGPCPHALAAVQAADPRSYPDPHYTALRARLGDLHGVDAHHIVLAASASEFIHRITALAQLRGAQAVALPAHSYGDYAQAAAARGLAILRPTDDGWAEAGLHWACEPSSPLGAWDSGLARWRKEGLHSVITPAVLRVVDCAYVPLRLDGEGDGWQSASASVFPVTAWQLWTPNKALGQTGVRAAYAVAPPQVWADDLASIHALAPSWPVGSHGVALLQAWADPKSQQWLASTLPILRAWKAAQQALCAEFGWAVVPGSLANYCVAKFPAGVRMDLGAALSLLRRQGIKLRDCESFGLPGHVRLGVLGPASQQALRYALRSLGIP